MGDLCDSRGQKSSGRTLNDANALQWQFSNGIVDVLHGMGGEGSSTGMIVLRSCCSGQFCKPLSQKDETTGRGRLLPQAY